MHFVYHSYFNNIFRYLWLFALSLWHSLTSAVRHSIDIHAASCTYHFLISLVPTTILIGWGASNFITSNSNMLEILQNIPFYSQLMKAVTSMGIVTTYSMNAVGMFGVLYWVWSASSLMRGMRRAFKTIFNSRKGSKKIIFTMLLAHIFIPLFILAAILFATVASTASRLLTWLLVDTLGLFNYQALLGTARNFISMALIVMAAYAGYMLLSPHKPRAKSAFIGSFLFGTYFLILQSVILTLMTNLIEKYSYYGALGTLLLMLLWAYLVFFGLFFMAEYTATIDDFNQRIYQRYIFTNLTKKPNIIDRILMKGLPFANDRFLKSITIGESIIFMERSAILILVSGQISVWHNKVETVLTAPSTRILIDTTLEKAKITALQNSRIMLVTEDIHKLFRNYPQIWEHLNLNNLKSL